MNCPDCGRDMEEGVLSGKTPVFWSESASGLPVPTSRSDVMLGKAMGLLRPKAYLCRKCRKVLIEY